MFNKIVICYILGFVFCTSLLSQKRIDVYISQEGLYECLNSSIDQPDVKTKEQLRIYPNPNKGIFWIEISQAKNINTALIYIYSITGKLVFAKKYNTMSNSYKLELNLSHLEKSIYFIRVQTSERYYNRKIILLE